MDDELDRGDSFSEQRLKEALGSRPFKFSPVVGSTNDIAREWAAQGAPAGALVITEEQTVGRGRFGRRWAAPAGTALLFSTIWRPVLAPEHLTRITIAGAVAIAETLTDLAGLRAEQVTLKWPNDVLLEGRKVAGILAEGVWAANWLEAVILGIGLNVKVPFENTELQHTATSIETIARLPIDRVALLTALLGRLETWVGQADSDRLMAAWRGRLATLGKQIAVQHVAGEVELQTPLRGIVLDVDADGALLLRDAQGTVHRIVAGDVTIVDEHEQA